LAKLERWKATKGWDLSWYSSYGTDFNYDFGVTIDESVAPAEYNFRSKVELQARGSDFFESGQSFELPARAASLKSRGGCFTPTPSTPVGSNPPAGPTISST